MAANDTIYCQKSSFTDTDWEKIYEVAFRPDQRTPLNQLHDGLRSGQMFLHRSSNKDGLLCFSVTNILPSVALLAYLATDPSKRSSGIGSKHMKALIAQVKTDNPHLLGMFAEIESTREKGISEDEKKHRRRRLQFYQRLGFKRYKSVYTIPSYEPTVPDEEGELIWLEFNTGSIGCDKLAEVIKEIYVKAYLLREDDVRVTSVPVLTGDAAVCALQDDSGTESSPDATTIAPDAVTVPGAAEVSPTGATAASNETQTASAIAPVEKTEAVIGIDVSTAPVAPAVPAFDAGVQPGQSAAPHEIAVSPVQAVETQNTLAKPTEQAPPTSPKTTE
jgi:GNAT superfamily N-acetyltransferase